MSQLNQLLWRSGVAAATTADLGATFHAGTTVSGDTLTGAAAAFAVDGYTALLNDRVLVKNQTAGLQNGIYSLTTKGSAASGVGPIATLGSVTGGANYPSGTYTGVPLSGGTGSGALATIGVTGPGIIFQTGSLVGGTLYNNSQPAQFANVALTGGTGTGARASITVQGGSVVNVVITTLGTGYSAADVLSASNANLGGTGSGFALTVTQVLAPVATAVITFAGTGYTVADVLSVPPSRIGTPSGTGFSVPVATVVPSNWVLTRTSDSTSNMEGLSVFVNNGTAGKGTAWAQTASPVTMDTTALVFVSFIP